MRRNKCEPAPPHPVFIDQQVMNSNNGVARSRCVQFNTSENPVKRKAINIDTSYVQGSIPEKSPIVHNRIRATAEDCPSQRNRMALGRAIITNSRHDELPKVGRLISSDEPGGV